MPVHLLLAFLVGVAHQHGYLRWFKVRSRRPAASVQPLCGQCCEAHLSHAHGALASCSAPLTSCRPQREWVMFSWWRQQFARCGAGQPQLPPLASCSPVSSNSVCLPEGHHLHTVSMMPVSTGDTQKAAPVLAGCSRASKSPLPQLQHPERHRPRAKRTAAQAAPAALGAPHPPMWHQTRPLGAAVAFAAAEPSRGQASLPVRARDFCLVSSWVY